MQNQQLRNEWPRTDTSHTPEENLSTAPTINPKVTPDKTVYTEEDRSANWKIYKNSNLNFEVKYPSNWYLVERTLTDNAEKLDLLFDRKPISTEDATQPMTHGWFELNIRVRTGSLPPEILSREGKSTGDVRGGVEYDAVMDQKITFAGQPANKSYAVSESTMGDRPRTGIVFNKEGDSWYISYPNHDLKGNHDPVYDQILSTFKFTK